VARVDATGPMTSSFPQGCYTNPFTTGVVWGIDQGWAVSALDLARIRFPGADGTYTVHLVIAPLYRRLFGIAPADATATLDETVITSPTGCPPYCPPAKTVAATTASSGTLPTRTHPRPSTLPDLVALPAWGMTIDEYSQPGRDFLDFGATVWDAGPAPMMVEGFRRTGTNIMDAWQTFYRGDKPVARAPVGTLEYDADPGHEHWHFDQFARYRLLGADKQAVVRSEKTGFCLAPTDAIDLTVSGAIWNPGKLGLGSACGDASAIWTRETLPTGWGDTYFQGLPGQSFDITDLPNGTYFIQVQADPTGDIYERVSTNDSRLRKVILGGVPGARTVTVPPWHGIDTG
jgi:lysyl oxidase